MGLKKKRVKPVGEILIEKKLITQEQLAQALEVQLKEGGLIGQILSKLGYIKQEELEKSLNEQTSDAQKLENILVELGMVSAEQLTQAEQIHKKDGGVLAQIIINLGFLTEEDLVSTLVTQFGFPFLQLDNYEIETELVKLVPKKIAQKFCLIPIDKIGNILTLAMADPLNDKAKDAVRRITNLNVETFISTFSDINKAIEKHFS